MRGTNPCAPTIGLFDREMVTISPGASHMFATQLKSRIPAAAVALSIAAGSLALAPLAVAQSSAAPGAVGAEATVDPSIHLERAETFTRDGRFDEAIAEYELAARAFRDAGELPTAALRSLA